MKLDELSVDDMMRIGVYMDDDIREELHNKLAPCTNEEFLKAYVEYVPEFEDLLKSEFSIEL